MKQVIDEILRYRKRLRLSHRWGEADAIRDELTALGIEIDDKGPETSYLLFNAKQNINLDLLKIRDNYIRDNKVVLSKVHGSFFVQVGVDDEELAEAIKDEIEKTIHLFKSLPKRNVEKDKLNGGN